MRLPENSIGISDILGYRDCPARFAWQMRRHLELPPHLQIEPGEHDEPPESVDWRNAYGLAIHLAISWVERDGIGHEEAIRHALAAYGTYLTPGDVALLREDLRTYEQRRQLGVTLVGAEMELRVPLFIYKGEQIYFRGRLDVVQRLISNPSVFLHRDYKSSKWPRTAKEIHEDPQLWAYNWAIHEYWPECETLIQTYDALRFGELTTTKSDQQRRDMKLWLIDMVTLILEDETWKPKLNEWCSYCAMVYSCREPRRATAYTRSRIAALAPTEKVGRKIRVAFRPNGDTIGELIGELPQMIETRKHIERVEEELKTVIEHMSDEQRERLGWELKDRRRRNISPEGLRALHEQMGDTFYQIANLPITRLEELVGKPKRGEPAPAELQIAREWTTEEVTGVNVVPANSA
jgi:hypothetical protein